MEEDRKRAGRKDVRERERERKKGRERRREGSEEEERKIDTQDPNQTHLF